MRRKVHVCQSVRGALKWSREELRNATKWIHKADGSNFTTDELHDAFCDELAQGHEVIPIGECDNFDFKTGCKGHAIPEDAC